MSGFLGGGEDGGGLGGRWWRRWGRRWWTWRRWRGGGGDGGGLVAEEGSEVERVEEMAGVMAGDKEGGTGEAAEEEATEDRRW